MYVNYKYKGVSAGASYDVMCGAEGNNVVLGRLPSLSTK